MKRDSARTFAPICKHALLIFIILLVFGQGVAFLSEALFESYKVEQLLMQVYIIAATVLSKAPSGYDELLSDYPEQLMRLVRPFVRSFSVYRWDGRWSCVCVFGDKTFGDDFLTRRFPPASFPQSFQRQGDIWVWRGNRRSAVRLKQPYVIYGGEHSGTDYLLVAELTPSVVELVFRQSKALRNRISLLSLLGAFLATFVVVFVFSRAARGQISALLRYIREPESGTPRVWDDLAPIVEEIERLRREQQELRFEFEREAAVITAKSEARLRSLSLLRDIASLGNSVTDMERMVQRMIERLNRFFHTYGAAAFIARPDGKVDIFMTDTLPPEFVDEVRRTIAPDAKQLSLRRVDTTGFVFLEDVKFVTEGTSFGELAKRNGIVGYLRIPLTHRGEYLGAVHLYSQRIFPTDEALEKLLRALSEEISVALESRKLYADLEQKLRESLALYEISKVLISAVDYDLLLEQILWIVQESFGFAATTILLLDEEENELYVKAAWGFQSDVTDVRIPVGKGVTGWVASTGQPLIVPDVTKDPRFIPPDPQIRSEMAVPLIVGGKVIGVLDVESHEVNRFSERDLWFLSSLAAQAALAIDRAKLYQKIKEQAVRDPLTGTYNRRYCDDYVQNQVRELLLKGTPVSIILVDINGLKRVNDTYGHAAGDKLLVEIADFLRENFPESPIARYGGDEFVVFLPGVSDDRLDEIVSKLRRLKTRWQLKLSEKYPFPFDFAIGAATATRPDELELLIDYADNLMYKDKHGLL